MRSRLVITMILTLWVMLLLLVLLVATRPMLRSCPLATSMRCHHLVIALLHTHTHTHTHTRDRVTVVWIIFKLLFGLFGDI